MKQTLESAKGRRVGPHKSWESCFSSGFVMFANPLSWFSSQFCARNWKRSKWKLKWGWNFDSFQGSRSQFGSRLGQRRSSTDSRWLVPLCREHGLSSPFLLKFYSLLKLKSIRHPHPTCWMSTVINITQVFVLKLVSLPCCPAPKRENGLSLTSKMDDRVLWWAVTDTVCPG